MTVVSERSSSTPTAEKLGTGRRRLTIDDVATKWVANRTQAVQLIAPTGELTDLGRDTGVDVELATRLYIDMARARRLDREALALQRQGELGLWLQSWGQEAAQVGSMHALEDTDWIFPSYRDHAAAMVRGVTPTELLTQWRGTTHAGWDPERYRFHFYSLVLGTQTLHATGYAMGAKLDGSSTLVATYFGDGAASQGDVSEAFNWATAQNLPIVFFCQNNQWAISTPTELQYGAPVHQRAAGFGMNSFLVDGNDVLAVHAVTQAAADSVRLGQGPALVEAVTYRMAGHSTSDDPNRYRPPAEFDLWEKQDPMRRVQTLLEGMGVSESFFAELEQELDSLAAEVRSACLAISGPDLDEVFGQVYAGPHPLVEHERAARRQYLASIEGV